MARWGRCDYRELKKLDERLQQLSEVDMDRLCRDAAKKVAQILLNKVKKRTPVGVVPSYATDEAKQEYWAGYRGGSLRDAWTILPIEKHGDQSVSYTHLVVRKVFRTLKDSCFTELKWAINRLGVSAYWEIKESPLEMTYLCCNWKNLLNMAKCILLRKMAVTEKKDMLPNIPY